MPLSKTVRNLIRTQEILRVAVRHGFGDLLQRMGLSQYLESAPSEGPEPPGPSPELMSTARRFRGALEELGGAFVKLGQLLSTRADILPADWIEELSHLQDDVIAIDFALVREVLEESLGPLEDHFQMVDPEPLAAGSIAQVHRGITTRGDDVVIKVRKPRIKETILNDYDILAAIAELAEKHLPEARNYRPMQVVEEFRKAVEDELDLQQEAEHLDRFRADFQGDPNIIFPLVYWDETTERVLTMQRVEGVKISRIDELLAGGSDTEAIARILAEAVLRQVLEFGFFHGDPHPGNVIVVDRTRLCFLDCGMVGRLDERMRENLVLLVSAGIRKDTETIMEILIDMNALPDSLDRERFIREANRFLERYYRLPLKRLRIASIIQDVNELVRKFEVRVPSDLLLVGKALITLEGVGRTLDPDFDAVAVAEPFMRKMVVSTYGPKYIIGKILRSSQDIMRLIRDFPADLRELSRTLRTSQLKLTIEHHGLKDASHEMDLASRRISLSIVTAATVIASSLIVLASPEPRIAGLPVAALPGFAISGALTVWLLWSVARKNRP
ncbi:MAG: phosphotransferase [Desulfomonile sp.]|nr:phosphotransferase [Desulfomonile sp.]